jgi:hypothetical protein
MDVGDIHRLKGECVNGPDVVYILDVLSVADDIELCASSGTVKTERNP